MTTIIYKRTNKWSEIVADKRAVWWYSMLTDTERKLIRYDDIVLWLTWSSIDRGLLEYIIIGFLKDKDLTDYFSPLLVKDLYNEIIKECWIKDPDITMLIVIWNICYTVLEWWHIEKHDNFVSIWSWCFLAEWIRLWNKDLDIQEYIPLISTKDEKTSFNFDYQLIK